VPRLLTVLTLASALFFATAGLAVAQVAPYAGAGYDASSYQCSNGTPVKVDPNFSSFGIVRVTGGRPFAVDSCRQVLWSQAVSGTTQAPSLYINVAYSGAYSRKVSGYCSTATSPEGYGGRYLQAYQIGCAESDYAFGHISTGSVTPTAWWIDVETANSWSSSDRLLNQAAIDGAADRLHFLSAGTVGVYSSASAWNAITSGPSFAPVSTSWAWVAGAANCTSSFSTGLTQRLRQSGQTSTGADADYAC